MSGKPMGSSPTNSLKVGGKGWPDAVDHVVLPHVSFGGHHC